jgi:hypothetical protein
MLLTPGADEVRIVSALRMEQQDYPIGWKG